VDVPDDSIALISPPEAFASLRNWDDWPFEEDLSPRQWEQLAQYLDTLLFWNRRLALVSQREPRAIVEKHVADSLVAAGCSADARSVVDLGSGAGFPAIPMAVCLPHAEICLIESRAKKVTFLREAIRICGLDNVGVVEGRIENAARGSLAGHFELATSRALGDLSSFLRCARPFLVQSGRVLAMKGPRFEEELRLVREANCQFAVERTIHYRLPDSTSRVILGFHVERSVV
jgi:16S rRNA (guanine527-N7)-methyltransferase